MKLDPPIFRLLFGPFGVLELLILWALLALLIFVFGMIVATSGGYPTARQFWRVHLAVLGAVFTLSGVCLLLLHIEPLVLLFSLSVLAFVVQGDLAATFQETPLEDWWLYRFHQRQLEAEEERERQREAEQERGE
jgi:hypothetical protein